ncbi:hypothetical protein D9758_003061 [Tetrapyrgos nigripes]|uniref:Rds1 protein n=1 Tax=Tetrapyrgos nigripes TaxID=182062 RepID=A0A8H5GQ48_9AGAR|nr:hypothetical protein D9758_003061 [Tetrapyrgos nigripes]
MFVSLLTYRLISSSLIYPLIMSFLASSTRSYVGFWLTGRVPIVDSDERMRDRERTRRSPLRLTSTMVSSKGAALSLGVVVVAAKVIPSALAAPAAPAQQPFTPAGGLGTNSTPPVYAPLSDFDFQSLNLALNQEYIELDLFHYGLAKFPVEEFEAAGLDAEDRFLIEYMADQEIGHAIALSNILGSNAAKACNYTYPFNDVRGFVDFCQKLTRWGESGVYGFLEHLDSRPSAQILLQSITVEARQQLIFRQFEGLFPMPEWHIPGITQSMTWTLLAPWITHCPQENPRIEWQNFPALNITNNPAPYKDSNLTAAISSNVSALSSPGQELTLTWEEPGKTVGYDGLYTTNTTAGEPKFVAWISQLNTTYTPLTNISGSSGKTTQPGGTIWGGNTAPLVNSTMFVLVTDEDVFVTAANISMLNAHVVAGPTAYQSG